MDWHSLEERRRSIMALPCSSRSCSTRFPSMAAMRSVMLFTGVKISAIAFMSGLLLAVHSRTPPTLSTASHPWHSNCCFQNSKVDPIQSVLLEGSKHRQKCRCHISLAFEVQASPSGPSAFEDERDSSLRSEC